MNYTHWTRTGGYCALLALLLSCGDDKISGAGKRQYEMESFHFETQEPNTLNIMFQVTDLSGKGVDDLVAADFEIFEDGKSVSPTESSFRIRKRDTLPFSLYTFVLIDISKSIAADLDQVKAAVISLAQAPVDGQRIVILTFSDTLAEIASVSDLPGEDAPVGVEEMRRTVNGLELGFATTNLYGAMIDGAGLMASSEWYNTTNIAQSYLIVFTDGSDTQGRHTLQEALDALRSRNRVYSVGLGSEIEPDVLRQLGSAGFFSIDDAGQLREKFQEIQADIVATANSFYWLSYNSPKRGYSQHQLLVTIKNSTTGRLEQSFSSRDFRSE